MSLCTHLESPHDTQACTLTHTNATWCVWCVVLVWWKGIVFSPVPTEEIQKILQLVKTPSHVQSHIHIHIHINVRIHMYIRIDIYIHIHMHIHTCIYTYAHIRTHVHTHVHIQIHMYIHMYTCICIYIRALLCLENVVNSLHSTCGQTRQGER